MKLKVLIVRTMALLSFAVMTLCNTCNYPQESYLYEVSNRTSDTIIVERIDVKQLVDTLRIDTLLPGYGPQLLFYFEFDGAKKGVSDIHPERVTIFKTFNVRKLDGMSSTSDLLQRDRWSLTIDDVQAQYWLEVKDTDF